MAEAVISNGAISLVQGVGEDALETAVREHARLVYRVAYSVLRNHHDAEDGNPRIARPIAGCAEALKCSRPHTGRNCRGANDQRIVGAITDVSGPANP